MFKKTDVGPAPAKPASRISEKGLEFIARWEGCVLHPYDDSVGYATIGVGHLIAYTHVRDLTAKQLAPYKAFTYTDAIRLLKQDAARFVQAVNSCHLHLTQPQFDALTSFAFNLGAGCLSQVAPYVRTGDWQVLQQYDHAGGVVLEGLRRRRASEINLAVHGVYG